MYLGHSLHKSQACSQTSVVSISGALSLIKIFALANSISEKIFKNLGATVMSTNKVCDAVWDECKTCPKYKMPQDGEIFKCCDTPYNLTNVCKGGDKK